MKLSIVIPCYNEKENLAELLARFAAVIKRADVEVVLVDNGSTDGSGERLAQLLPRYPFARCVTVPVNQGYGHGILAGLAEARGDFLGWTHADLQTDPGDLIRALEIIEAHGGTPELFVKGSRVGRPLFDRFFTAGMSIFETMYLQRVMREINAQPNVFHRTFFDSWKAPPRDFALDLYALYMAKKNGLTVLRFPVRFPERRHGTSKWNTGLASKWKFIKRTVAFSRELKERGIE